MFVAHRRHDLLVKQLRGGGVLQRASHAVGFEAETLLAGSGEDVALLLERELREVLSAWPLS